MERTTQFINLRLKIVPCGTPKGCISRPPEGVIKAPRTRKRSRAAFMLSAGYGVACGEGYRPGPYRLAPAWAGVQHMKPCGGAGSLVVRVDQKGGALSRGFALRF